MVEVNSEQRVSSRGCAGVGNARRHRHTGACSQYVVSLGELGGTIRQLQPLERLRPAVLGGPAFPGLQQMKSEEAIPECIQSVMES